MKEHDWITVGGRRWCLRCEVYRQGYFPRQIADCEDTTPYAVQHPRAALQEQEARE